MRIAYVILAFVIIGSSYAGHRFLKSFAPGGSRDDGVSYIAKHDSIRAAEAAEAEALALARLEQSVQADTIVSDSLAADGAVSPGLNSEAASEVMPEAKVSLFQVLIILSVFVFLLGFPVISIVDIARRGYPKRKSTFWVIVVIILPVMGTLVYFLVGRRIMKPSSSSSA